MKPSSTLKTHVMKKYPATVALLALLPLFSLAQSKPVRIVFDVSNNDTLTHQTAMRHAGAEAKAHPDGKLEIVVYSGALDMVVKGKSTVAPAIQELMTRKNASIKVCEATMKRHSVDKTQLLPGVEIVADGIIEIIDRQADGWGYIKEAR
jgi:intracellular sulfur oxidation DsrE/DsrF family protein